MGCRRTLRRMGAVELTREAVAAGGDRTRGAAADRLQAAGIAPGKSAMAGWPHGTPASPR